MLQALLIGLFVIAACACLAWLGVRLRGKHFGGNAALRRLVCLVCLAVYAGGVFWLTLGSREVRAERSAKLGLLWSYRESLALFGGSPGVTDASLLAEIVLNVLLFVPLGALLPFAWPEHFRGRRGAGLAAVIGACASLGIELLQLVFRLGLFEFDDVLNNALGAVGGYLVYSLLYVLMMRVDGRAGGS